MAVASLFRSLPSRERELKPHPRYLHVRNTWSLPSRERELKHGYLIVIQPVLTVAPFTGA